MLGRRHGPDSAENCLEVVHVPALIQRRQSSTSVRMYVSAHFSALVCRSRREFYSRVTRHGVVRRVCQFTSSMSMSTYTLMHKSPPQRQPQQPPQQQPQQRSVAIDKLLMCSFDAVAGSLHGALLRSAWLATDPGCFWLNSTGLCYSFGVIFC